MLELVWSSGWNWHVSYYLEKRSWWICCEQASIRASCRSIQVIVFSFIFQKQKILHKLWFPVTSCDDVSAHKKEERRTQKKPSSSLQGYVKPRDADKREWGIYTDISRIYTRCTAPHELKICIPLIQGRPAIWDENCAETLCKFLNTILQIYISFYEFILTSFMARNGLGMILH